MDLDENQDMDIVVVVEGIPNITVLMVVIPQILIKRKPHCTTKSGVILRQNKKIGSINKINLLRTTRTIVIDMV